MDEIVMQAQNTTSFQPDFPTEAMTHTTNKPFGKFTIYAKKNLPIISQPK
jgi:hypothetical protein